VHAAVFGAHWNGDLGRVKMTLKGYFDPFDEAILESSVEVLSQSVFGMFHIQMSLLQFLLNLVCFQRSYSCDYDEMRTVAILPGSL
jgi:hypothetical protein